MCDMRFIFKFFFVGLVATVLAACAGTGKTPSPTGEGGSGSQDLKNSASLTNQDDMAAVERADPITQANFWAMKYRENSADLTVTIRFLKALRALGSHERVAEIATDALQIHPKSHAIYLELARSLLSSGQLIQANQTFARAVELAPADDAAPLAGLGLSFDRLEDHDRAQQAYKAALKREPDRVSTLSNYAMSLVLTGQLDSAEALLRKAVNLPGADVRVRQNLALILGLQGRYDEMLAVDPTAPRQVVEANRKALRDISRPSPDYQADEALPQSNEETHNQSDDTEESAQKPSKLRGSQTD